jgi:putative ABC transport system ATP-binding protein
LCDEPTAALDAETGHAVIELLAEIALRPDRAVIVVTHDNRIFDFADRIAFMEDGHIVRIEAKPDRHAIQWRDRYETRQRPLQVLAAGGNL